MATKPKPRFSWEPLEGGSLRVRVETPGREVSWTIKKGQSVHQWVHTLEEVVDELLDALPASSFEEAAKLTSEDRPGPGDYVAYAKTQDVVTEDMSKAALKARAADAAAHGGQWWKENVNELPFKETTHGEPTE